MASALAVIDVQYDFLPGGSLAVNDGDKILPKVYELIDRGSWDVVVASQDYHPEGHISFASTHSKPVFETIKVPLPEQLATGGTKEIDQMLWPDHCVQGTRGSEFEEGVNERLKREISRTHIIRKGVDADVDAYSAFATPLSPFPSEGAPVPPLAAFLRSKSVRDIFVCGLATDFCVAATARDAVKEGFQTYVIREAVKAVGGKEASEKTFRDLEKVGCKVVSIDDEIVQTKLR